MLSIIYWLTHAHAWCSGVLFDERNCGETVVVCCLMYQAFTSTLPEQKVIALARTNYHIKYWTKQTSVHSIQWLDLFYRNNVLNVCPAIPKSLENIQNPRWKKNANLYLVCYLEKTMFILLIVLATCFFSKSDLRRFPLNCTDWYWYSTWYNTHTMWRVFKL